MTTNKTQEFFDVLEQLKRNADEMFCASDPIEGWYKAQNNLDSLYTLEGILKNYKEYCDACIEAAIPDDNL